MPVADKSKVICDQYYKLIIPSGYRRNAGNRNAHDLIAEIPVSTIESDGSDVTNIHLNDQFPAGMFVAMSNGKVFHYYDWRNLQQMIDRNKH